MPGSVLAEGDAPAMARPRKYPDELRERAVRLVFESKRPIAHVAQDLGRAQGVAEPLGAAGRSR
jgi:transposase-like protein